MKYLIILHYNEPIHSFNDANDSDEYQDCWIHQIVIKAEDEITAKLYVQNYEFSKNCYGELLYKEAYVTIEFGKVQK